MIDDREYILYKLLCRLADKTAFSSKHAVVYITANMNNGEPQLDLDASWSFSCLSDSIRCQLSSCDLIVKLCDDSFAIIYRSTSEEQTQQSTQLITDIFQQLPCTKNSWNIAVGAALFDQASTTVTDLISTVCECAFQSRSENKIVYQNLTSTCPEQHSSASKAA